MPDQVFKGQKYLFPQINQPNNEALVLAMQHKGCVLYPMVFRKDKSGEKLAETEEDLLEHRTDGADTIDTLFIGMNFIATKPAPGALGWGWLGELLKNA